MHLHYHPPPGSVNVAAMYHPCPLLKQEGDPISPLLDKEGVGVVGSSQGGQQGRPYINNRT